MMLDFHVQRFTRRCAKTERELQAGEVYYSVLVPEGSDVLRRDFCESAWEGPPPGAIGFWRGRVPGARGHQFHFAPNDVLLDYFTHLAEDPAKEDVYYVLGLLLLRRRVLRLEETERHGDREVLVMACHRNEQQYKLVSVDLGAERAREIQDELAALLSADDSTGEAPS